MLCFLSNYSLLTKKMLTVLKFNYNSVQRTTNPTVFHISLSNCRLQSEAVVVELLLNDFEK